MIDKNMLICGDNEFVLDTIDKESIDLIYIDPPFFTNKQYEVIWGDEAETRSFEDRWEGGIENYIAWMETRIQKMYDVLKPTGSFYLHCDWHANAHLRLLLDKIFGERNFRNEIIWHYRKWTAGFRQFQRNHDVVLFYSKTDSKERIFNIDYMDRTESTLKRFGKSKIVSGYNEDGSRTPSKMEVNESKGVPRDDVWSIGRVPPVKQLFPTQKPDLLLERIINASSQKNNIIMDTFCGCGTTIVIAQKLNRKWIGIDISPTAINVIKERLIGIGAHENEHYIITGQPITVSELLEFKPFEFQNWVNNRLKAYNSKKKSGDLGIDGYFPGNVVTEKFAVQVKQSEGIGRIEVDKFKSALERAGYKKGFLVAISFGRGAVEEVARLKNKGEISIILKTLEDLLHNKPN